MNPGIMPDFALKAFMKSKATKPIADMVTKFKKSATYAKLNQ